MDRRYFQRLLKDEKRANRIRPSAALKQIVRLFKVPVTFLIAAHSHQSGPWPDKPFHGNGDDRIPGTREGIRFVKACMQIKRRHLRGAIVRPIDDPAKFTSYDSSR